MFGLFGRKSKEPPPVEWQCGGARRAQILDALESATDAKVSLYRNGNLQWTRDVAKTLHEFTCRAVEQVLNRSAPTPIPVYCARPRSKLDPNSAAMAMAQQHADPNANASLEQMIIRLPDSFAEALACKRRWLLDQAADDEILAAAARVARDTQFFWPSNFCLRINSLQAATWCVLSAMNLEAPWLAAHGCAQTAASFMGCLAACHTMQCSAISHDTRQLAWEGAQIGEQTFTRGVACPQAGNPAIERLATQALNATSADWWQRLNDDLTTALLQFAA